MASKTLVFASGRAKPRQAQSAADGLVGKAGEDDTQIVRALARGLDVLDAFRRTDIGLGNAELAERTGLTRPTVSRLAYTLARCGYLSFDPHRREYHLGARAMSLAAVAQAVARIRTCALPLMRDLAAGSHFNIGLGTRDGHQMVYTDACEGDTLIGLRLFPGSRIPLATTAMGRAYLSVMAPEARDALLGELRKRYDEEWPHILRGVERAIKDVGKRGFCASIGDWQKDIHGVAVPIRGPSGQPAYAMNLGGPAYMLPERELVDTLGPRLVQIARAVERLVGIEEPSSRNKG